MFVPTLPLFIEISYSLLSISLLSISGQNKEHGGGGVTHGGLYTEQERNALPLFREMVADVLENDFERKDQFLVRWIRVCGLNLNEASQMLRRAKQWRKDKHMDTIMEENPFDVGGKDMCNINGVARDGTPVFSIVTVNFDIRKILMTGLKSNLTRKMSQCIESVALKLRNFTEITGKDYSKAIGIVNAGGYNLKQHACFDCLSFYLDFLRDAQNFYPEYLKLVVLVNAPKVLKPMLDMVKPMMNSNTLNAIKVFGIDKKEWSSFLLEHIATDQLSRQFGGTANW